MKKFKLFIISAAYSACFAGGAGAVVLSTAGARTELDAAKVIASQVDLNGGKAAQDHFYDGNSRTLSLGGGVVVAGPPGSNNTPAAKYTGPAAGPKVLTMGKVPPLAVDPGVKAKAAPAAKKAASSPTPAEIEAAKTIFGTKINLSKVKVITGKDMTLWGKILTMGGKAVVWGNKIYFPNDSNGKSKFDFGKDPAWYMHEVAHVYQYQNYGWSYIPRSLWAQITEGKGAYDYQLVPGKAFRDYQIEQQAEIVRDYYNITAGRSGGTSAERSVMEAALQGEGLLK